MCPALLQHPLGDLLLSTTRAPRCWVLNSDFDAMPATERNYTRWLFLDQDARDLFVDWQVQARVAVENLRLDTHRSGRPRRRSSPNCGN